MPITVEHISYCYEKGTPYVVPALTDLSFTLNDGEFVGLMGATGCGKTTLLQLIAGLLTPQEGRVLLDGCDINAKGYPRVLLRKSVGVLVQSPEYQLFETTVERDVSFGLKHSGLSRSAVERRVQWALETVGFSFDHIRKKSPLALSGGEKRRVAMAGVLVTKPGYLILDEPTSGLDPLGRRSFLELLAELHRHGTTILMASHSADSLSEYAQRIVVLQNGRLELDGSPESVFSNLAGARKLSICAGQCRTLAGLLQKGGFPISPQITRYSALLEVLVQGLQGGDRL